jgi:hypothetical protein
VVAAAVAAAGAWLDEGREEETSEEEEEWARIASHTARTAPGPWRRVALTPGCHWIGYMDHPGCHQLVSSTIRPPRVVVTPGCQIGPVDHTAVINWCF